MSRIIAIANVKGGVGKTTTTGNLAAALAERGHRVLAIDLDPQASLTDWLCPGSEHPGKTIEFPISSSSTPISSLLVTTRERFDLAPAAHDLLTAERELNQGDIRINALRGALTPLRDKYDFVLIDCPANAGILTGNALAAGEEVLIPFLPEFPSIQALDWFLSVIKEMQRRVAPNLQILGLFLSNYDPHLRHTRYVIEHVQKKYGAEVPFFSAAVRQSVTIRQAALHKTSILLEAPSSPAALAYRALATDVEKGVVRRPPVEINQVLKEGEDALQLQDLSKETVYYARTSETSTGNDEARRNPETDQSRVKAEAFAIVEYSQSIMRAGAGEDAHAGFVQATQLDPQNEQAWIGCARTSTDIDQAFKCVGRALEINPHNPEALELRDWLRQLQDDPKSTVRKQPPRLYLFGILIFLLLLVTLVGLFLAEHLGKG